MEKDPDSSPILPGASKPKKDYKFDDFVEENREPKPESTPAPPAEEYTPVSLPSESSKSAVATDSEMSSTSAPAETASAPVEPRQRGKLRSAVHHHPRWSLTIAILLLLFVGCIAFGIVFLRHYSERADNYDLATVQRVGAGSIALDANGKLLGQVALKDRRHVDLENVPEHLIQAIIATEDHRFREHNGVDLKGIARAFVANLKAGGIIQGGSTITQQLARHAFDLGGRTIKRKMAELLLARRIEKRFTKDEILEAYLNRIYLGSGFWGVGAAARGYFGKDVSELNLSESATIAALIKSPNGLSPFNDLQASTVARNRTLSRMSELGSISEEKESEIAAIEVEIVSPEKRAQRPHYLLAAIRKEALDILGQYCDLSELEISTTVDLDLQARAKLLLDDQLARIERHENFAYKSKSESAVEKSTDYLQGALVVIENETGKIISAVGGRDYADSQYDRVWQSRRAPGTALVPFVYAHAFEAGQVTPFTQVLDAPLDNKKVMIGGTEGILGEWGTETLDNDYEGEIPAVYALARGKNGVAVRVGQQLGVDSFGQMLTDAGVKSKLNGYSSSFLGESPIKLLELVHAYTVFPNLGTRADKLRMITSIKDREGNVVYSAPRSELPVQVMSEGTASIINSVLSKTFEIDPIRLRSRGFGDGFAGKAGTSYEFEDNWFVGYDADYTWGVWIGFDKPKPIYENAFGSTTAFPVWHSLASSLSSGKPIPLGSSMAKDEVCLLSGKPATEFCQYTENGNLVVRLPLEQTGDSSPGPCEIHQSKTEPLDFEAVPEPVFEPDLFSGFTPVKPTVEAVIGNNPWTVEAKRD